MARRHKTFSGAIAQIILLVIIGFVVMKAFRSDRPAPMKPEDLPTLLQARADVPRREGIAVALLVDTSGSMKEAVTAADGSKKPKMEIARSAVLAVIKQVEGFASDPAAGGKPVMLGVHEFSGRNGVDRARVVLPMAAPDAGAAQKALGALKPDGDTPIGDAIVAARRSLDAAGLSKMHILVVTDGQNTQGLNPAEVVAALAKLPEEQRPGVYFIAFDVAASVFEKVKDAGALILPAANEKELQQTLDFVIGNKVLLEQ